MGEKKSQIHQEMITRYIDAERFIETIKKRAERYDKNGKQIPLNDVFLSTEEIIALVEKHIREDELIYKPCGLEDISWKMIQEIVEHKEFSKYFPSGTKLPLVLSNGDDVGLVVGYDKEGYAYLVFSRSMGHFMAMSNKIPPAREYDKTDFAGYAKMQMEIMIPETVLSIADNVILHETLSDGVIVTPKQTHKIFVLSYTQVFGNNNSISTNDSQIDIFCKKENRRRLRAGNIDADTTAWWLRTPNGNDKFWAVSTEGEPITMHASTVLSPVFAIRVKGTGNHNFK